MIRFEKINYLLRKDDLLIRSYDLTKESYLFVSKIWNLFQEYAFYEFDTKNRFQYCGEDDVRDNGAGG